MSGGFNVLSGVSVWNALSRIILTSAPVSILNSIGVESTYRSAQPSQSLWPHSLTCCCNTLAQCPILWQLWHLAFPAGHFSSLLCCALPHLLHFFSFPPIFCPFACLVVTVVVSSLCFYVWTAPPVLIPKPLLPASLLVLWPPLMVWRSVPSVPAWGLPSALACVRAPCLVSQRRCGRRCSHLELHLTHTALIDHTGHG